MDVKSLVDIISQGGAVGLLAFFLVAGFKGWIVWGREFNRETQRRKEVEQERNDWRDLALRGTNLAESLTQVQERRIFSDK
jgi:hypothetical protein